jgi:hypothetical protein
MEVRRGAPDICKLAAVFLVTAVGVVMKLGLELPDRAAPVAWATLIGGCYLAG